MWVAAMTRHVTGDATLFEEVEDALYEFVLTSTDRVPLSDWIHTTSPTFKGFQARSVVGGIYAHTLLERLAEQRRV